MRGRAGWFALAALGILGMVVGFGYRTYECYDYIVPREPSCTSDSALWLVFPSAAVAVIALVKAFRRRD